MIIDFSFKNYKSFKDGQSFSMRRETSIDHEKESITTKSGDFVNRVSAVYGANAAGKSNFLESILVLRNLIAHGRIDKNNFAGSDDLGTLFRIIFEYAGNKYDYSVSASPKVINFEKLSIYYTNQPSLVYEYTAKPRNLKVGSSLICADEETAINYNSDKEPSKPILYLLKDSDNKDVKNAFDFFIKGIISQSMPIESNTNMTEAKLEKIFEKDTPDGTFFNTIIPSADLGIKNVELIDVESELNANQMKVLADALIEVNRLGDSKMSKKDEEALRKSMSRTARRASFTHKIGNKTLNFWLGDESNGTIAASNIFTDLRNILAHGAVYIVDEIDRSLHPSLVIQLIDIFNHSETNPYNAQIIFSTHDVSMLDSSIYGKNILDRDQVWFVEKDQSGKSSLYSLAQIKGTRKEDNLYRKYISGRYGATPKPFLYYEVKKYWEDLKGE